MKFRGLSKLASVGILTLSYETFMLLNQLFDHCLCVWIIRASQIGHPHPKAWATNGCLLSYASCRKIGDVDTSWVRNINAVESPKHSCAWLNVCDFHTGPCRRLDSSWNRESRCAQNGAIEMKVRELSAAQRYSQSLNTRIFDFSDVAVDSKVWKRPSSYILYVSNNEWDFHTLCNFSRPLDQVSLELKTCDRWKTYPSRHWPNRNDVKSGRKTSSWCRGSFCANCVWRMSGLWTAKGRCPIFKGRTVDCSKNFNMSACSLTSLHTHSIANRDAKALSAILRSSSCKDCTKNTSSFSEGSEKRPCLIICPALCACFVVLPHHYLHDSH